MSNFMNNQKIQQDKVEAFYNLQVLNNPDMPAILGVSSKLGADFRDFEEWKSFYSLVTLRNDMRVLELGCGGGRWVERLSRYVKEVIGVDLSKNAINYAKKCANVKKIHNVEYIHSSIREYEADGFFDIIYLSGVLLYIDNEEVLYDIEKYNRCLKQDGIFVVRDSITNVNHILHHQEGYCSLYRTLEDFEKFFKEVNFRLTKKRKAFPNLCLSNFLNLSSIKSLYQILQPIKLQKFLIFLLDVISRRDEGLPHWVINGYNYSHDFLIFSKS